jgi:zinc D-Ala-D-Ala dipeptidase
MFLLILMMVSLNSMAQMHADFVSLSEVCPSLIIRADYAGADNFTGTVLPGYRARKALMARTAAKALCQVQQEAMKQGLTLLIFDGYRPAKAVAFFQHWAQGPEDNPSLKEMYYPKFSRQQLFEKGYIAKRSSHSRGSAVDLTLAEINTGEELDMGTRFDYFDDLSHTNSSQVSSLQRKHRLLLKSLMEVRGFKNFDQEWWHFSYRPEPHPQQYFDFDIE